jgi:hypothetical protein
MRRLHVPQMRVKIQVAPGRTTASWRLLIGLFNIWSYASCFLLLYVTSGFPELIDIMTHHIAHLHYLGFALH